MRQQELKCSLCDLSCYEDLESGTQWYVYVMHFLIHSFIHLEYFVISPQICAPIILVSNFIDQFIKYNLGSMLPNDSEYSPFNLTGVARQL